MNNKTLYILTALFILLGIAAWWITTHSDSKSSIDTADRQFAIEDENEVYKIFMVRKGGKPIQLEKKNGEWYVNDRYKAFINPVQNLLYAMSHISIKSIPPKPAYEVIMKDFSEIGLKVEIYGKNQNKLKTYYIGGVTDDETGVYFLMDGYRQPYIMHLDKKVSNVRQRYELALDDWRERAMIPVKPEDISTLEVSYPYEPERSFRISQVENKYNIQSLGALSISTSHVKSKFLRSYLENIPLAMIEAYKNLHPAKDSIPLLTPYCRIRITKSSAVDTFSLSLYPVNDHLDAPVDLSPEFLSQRNFFRFFVHRSDGDFMMTQIQQIDMILKDFQDMIKG
ncbi:MAG: DUF4340 domain-containing protein [Saprospiraceae bacterium]|nr:DUF4340 domain-containing protein [Saprospiraceae bacterium]